MRRFLLAALILLVTVPAGGQIIQPGIIPGHLSKCDYYASPSGSSSNDGKTQSAPIRITDFWGVATAGSTLCLMNGLYQGSANIITPPLGLSGTGNTSNWPPGDRGIASGSSPITIRAVRDGGALIDGQHTLRPVQLLGNDWFVLEGFNVKRSARHVIVLSGGANNNILRRIVAWDANMSEGGVVLIESSANNLFEDVALFGVGTNSLHNFSGSSTGNILRRVWARWEGSANINFKRGLSLQYGDHAAAAQCENCLATWSAESMPETYRVMNGDGDPSTETRTNFSIKNSLHMLGHGTGKSANPCINGNIFGSLAYLKATDGARGSDHPTSMIRDSGTSCTTMRHVFAFLHPSHPKTGILPNSGLRANEMNFAGSSLTARNLTSVSSSNQVSIHSTWGATATSSFGTSLGGVANPWTASSVGANLCFRWVNGAVTTTPLWPWLMNDRIKDATRTAGAYTGTCVDCTGGRASRTETNVTADIEALLGTIPSACRS